MAVNGLLKMNILGAFHSMKNSGLNFQKFPVTNRTAFSRISRKADNLATYTQIFRHFLPGIWNFWLNGLLFRNSTISGFSGNFPGKFPYHLSLFQNFLNVWLNGKCPLTLSQFLQKLWYMCIK